MTNLCLISTKQEIELDVSFVYPPIPIRSFDWCAIDANTYDGDWDGEAECYVSKSAQGEGATKMEAINDLIDQLEEEHGE